MTEHAGVSVTAPVGRRVEVAPGVILHAEQRAGERAAAPFVLVHGLASNVRLWDGAQLRTLVLAQAREVVAVEQHAPARRAIEPRQQAEQRALAAAGRPCDREHA